MMNWILRGRVNDNNDANDGEDRMEDIPQDNPSSPSTENLTMQQIREMRLRKFHGVGGKPGENQEEKETDKSVQPQSEWKGVKGSESDNTFQTPTKLTKASPPPSDLSASKPIFTPTQSPSIVSTGNSENVRTPSSLSRPSSAMSPQSKTSNLSLEDRYIHDTICRIFKVTLITRGTSTIFLEKIASTGKIYFSLEDVDSIFLEKMLYVDGSYFDFLMEVYNKCHHEISEVSDKTHKLPSEFRKKVLEFIEKASISYSHLFLLNPDCFPDRSSLSFTNLNTISTGRPGYNSSGYYGPDKGAAILLNQLLVPADHPGFVPRGFFTSLVDIAGESLSTIITPLISQIFHMVRHMNINHTQWYPLLKAIELFAQIPDIANILVTHPYWIPPTANKDDKIDGKSVETKSILGVFFALHGADSETANSFFGGGKTLQLTVPEIQEAKKIFRQRRKNVQGTLKNILLQLLKRVQTREHALKWFAVALEANETRNRLRDNQTNSSDGFMINLLAVLLRLCAPFVESNLNESKNKVDPKYPMMNDAFNVFKEDTKVNISNKEAVEQFSKMDPVKEFNFVTACYYLTLRAVHLGFVVTCNKFVEFLKQQSHMQREYEKLKQARNERDLALIEPQVIQSWIHRWTTESLIYDADLHQDVLKFYRFSAVLLLDWCGIPLQTKSLDAVPRSIDELPLLFRSQPEHMIEDILVSLTFLGRYKPSSLSWGSYDEIFTFLIALLNFGYLVKNPYIRAKIPELLVFFVPSKEAPHEVNSKVINHQLTENYLMRGFMRLYVEIESTGASSQFYDKFTPRFWISIIIKSLWEYPVFKEAFKKESEVSDLHDFLKFFNMLLNDAIFLLDESLKMLKEIHDYENDLRNGNIPPNQMNERQRQVGQNTHILQTYMMLARETVNMLHYLSKDFPFPFLRPEMVPRVAAMLNYFLMHLAGDECQNLKVQNAEKYHFNPKELITLLSETYMHFSGFDEFVKAVAEDERSYRAEILQVKVPSILNRIGTCSKKFIEDFLKFAERVQAKAADLHQDDEDYSDAPDEFLDAITFVIMEDPVKLPSSGVVLDRPTIERHLLNDNTDPFNRAPLTVKDLIPQPELKKQIEDWKISKRSEKQ